MKRIVGLIVAMTLLPAAAAAAQEGAPDLGVKESPARVKATGPGFTVKLRAHGLKVAIDDERFGIPEAGFEIQRATQALPPTVRPFVCENGTYRVVSGTFETVERASATALRPPPYPAAFGNAFPDIITFVGTLDAVVVNEAGEQFRLLMSDLAHEVITPDVVLRHGADPRLHRRRGRHHRRPRVAGRPGQRRPHDGRRRALDRRRGHLPPDRDPARPAGRDGVRAVLRAPVPDDGGAGVIRFTRRHGRGGPPRSRAARPAGRPRR